MIFRTANQCYSRFWKVYDLCQLCVDNVIEASLSARSEFKSDRISFNRALRYLNAAHMFGYVGLRTGHDIENFVKPFNGQYFLLTPAEVDQLSALCSQPGGDRRCFNTLILWAFDTAGSTSLTKNIKDLRKSIAALWELEEEPVPFVYIWLAYLLSSIYLVVFVLYVSQFPSTPIDELIGIVIVIINNVIISMQIVYMLANPHSLRCLLLDFQVLVLGYRQR